jgi:cell division protease FtsH
VRSLVDAAYAHASELLASRRELLDEMAGRLLDHETLDEAELAAIAARLRGATAASA